MMSLRSSRICRICEQSTTNLENMLFIKNERLVQQYVACANVEFDIDDELPKFLCHHCVTNLNKAYQFKKQCEYAQKKFYSRIFGVATIKLPTIEHTTKSTTISDNDKETTINIIRKKSTEKKIVNRKHKFAAETKLSTPIIEAASAIENHLPDDTHSYTIVENYSSTATIDDSLDVAKIDVLPISPMAGKKMIFLKKLKQKPKSYCNEPAKKLLILSSAAKNENQSTDICEDICLDDGTIIPTKITSIRIQSIGAQYQHNNA